MEDFIVLVYKFVFVCRLVLNVHFVRAVLQPLFVSYLLLICCISSLLYFTDLIHSFVLSMCIFNLFSKTPNSISNLILNIQKSTLNSQGPWIHSFTPPTSGKTLALHRKECLRYDITLHVMLRLLFFILGEFGTHIYWLYS